MSDERMARPVSGEIMSDGQRGGGGSRGSDDIIDADFETIVPDARSEARAENKSAAPQAGQAGMDMLRNGGGRGARKRQSGGPMFWTIGLALVFGAFWVSGGHAIVSNRVPEPAQSAAPQSAAQPLHIVNVVSRIDRTGGRAFLLVDGEVANESVSNADLPPLAIMVTARDGGETRYFLGTNGKVLKPGERYSFSSRLHAPNEGVATVTVDFRKESGG